MADIKLQEQDATSLQLELEDLTWQHQREQMSLISQLDDEDDAMANELEHQFNGGLIALTESFLEKYGIRSEDLAPPPLDAKQQTLQIVMHEKRKTARKKKQQKLLEEQECQLADCRYGYLLCFQFEVEL